MRAHGMMFHHFHDDKKHIRSQGSISAKEFSEMLRYYRQKGYRLLPAAEWYEKAVAGKLAENEVCITFDDGLKSQYEIAAPVLATESLTGFYFIPTNFLCGEGGKNKLEIYRHFRSLKFENIEVFYQVFFDTVMRNSSDFQKDVKKELAGFDPDRFLEGFPFYTDSDKRFRFLRDEVFQEEEYDRVMTKMMENYDYRPEEHVKDLWMSKDDIQALYQTGNLIGLHSHNHPTVLATYPYSRQKEEYLQNREILQSLTGEAIKIASYPCNSYNDDSLTIMRELGVCLGFRANMEVKHELVLEWPREDHANILRRMKDENYGIYR